jgi:small subunit ribosomal protein S6
MTMNVSTPAPAARSTGGVRTREYETIYVLRSDVDGDSAEKVQHRVAEAIEREHGKLVKVEAWGRRKLAYPVGKQRKGVYVYVKYVGGGGLVAEVERNLKLLDHVMKYMTVQTSEDVDLAALQIDPEETKLGKLDLPTEPEPEESREKQLGLVDLGEDRPRGMRGGGMDEADEFADDEMRGGDRAERAERPATTTSDEPPVAPKAEPGGEES